MKAWSQTKLIQWHQRPWICAEWCQIKMSYRNYTWEPTTTQTYYFYVSQPENERDVRVTCDVERNMIHVQMHTSISDSIQKYSIVHHALQLNLQKPYQSGILIPDHYTKCTTHQHKNVTCKTELTFRSPFCSRVPHLTSFQICLLCYHVICWANAQKWSSVTAVTLWRDWWPLCTYNIKAHDATGRFPRKWDVEHVNKMLIRQLSMQ